MLHNYNQNAFQVGAASSDTPLLCLYCSLVVLELSIKDYLYHQSGLWKRGHCIVDWLTHELGETSLGVQLQDKLANLSCTYKDGSEVPIDANRYPDLRYLRHEDDFPGKSTDIQLGEVLEIVKDIKTTLLNRGMNL
ncbi:hypothetical protein PGN35_023355 [Nodosilinea sp. PGN35]|uniref:hypothetical protein n=1 Tax=Nodosilinea sp. PGN35 TaxID=3020489 RepID=UPI0023B3047E|nr:hypothetical protein [Nodosilinea sp. TSF1-S3]MDF0369949.1 hypothetical protein [Nodosilinea sp. TSF1-S3]